MSKTTEPERTNSRATGQRRAIRDVLEQSDRPLTAQEIVDAASAQGVSLGLATVYRNIKRLVDEGDAIPIEFAGEPARYERADHHHHHHFRCDACSRVFDVDGCGSNLTKSLERDAPDGFVVRTHEVWLHGVCAECAAPAA